jgi:hypothetical protein
MSTTGSMRAGIGTLIVATSIVQLANGFFGTLISLRVSLENFGAPSRGSSSAAILRGSPWERPDEASSTGPIGAAAAER